MRLAQIGVVTLALLPFALPAPGQETSPLTYEELLADPGNPALNFRWAREQAAAGNLSASASALERLLIARPDWDEVRLLYGIVLYRLGQIDEAAAELDAVDPAALAAPERETLARFRERVARERRRVQGDVGLTLGLHHDTNRNNFPLDGRFQIDLPGFGETVIDAGGDENGDIGRFVLVDGALRIDTGRQRFREVSLEAAALVDDQVEEDALDLVSGLMGVGALYAGDVLDIRPRAAIRAIGLDGEGYLTAAEGRLRLEHRVNGGGRLVLFADLFGGYEDFSGVAADPFAGEADGAYGGLGAGAVWTPLDRLRLSARYVFTDKAAAEAFEAFTAHQIRLGGEYVVADGVSLTATLRYTRQDFDAPDPFVSAGTERADDGFGGGAGVFVSVDRILAVTGVATGGGLAEDLVLGLTADYRRTDSNIVNFDTDNLRIGLTLTKRFRF